MNFVAAAMIATPGKHRADQVDRQRPPPARLSVVPPVRHHPALRERERHEHTTANSGISGAV